MNIKTLSFLAAFLFGLTAGYASLALARDNNSSGPSASSGDPTQLVQSSDSSSGQNGDDDDASDDNGQDDHGDHSGNDHEGGDDHGGGDHGGGHD